MNPKILLTIILVLFLSGFVILGNVSATTTHSYNDTNFEWIDYPRAPDVPTPLVGIDAVGGNPNILWVEVDVNDTDYLEQIRIYHQTGHGVGLSNGPGNIGGVDIPGDFISLFINIDSGDFGWDYYVKLKNDGPSFSANAYDLNLSGSWSYDFPENYPDAMVTGSRFGHPNGVLTGSLTSASILDGTPTVFDDDSESFNIVTYYFLDNVVQLGSEFNIGATQYCANDNFVVPIPGTLYLIGAGLIGLVGIRNKRQS